MKKKKNIKIIVKKYVTNSISRYLKNKGKPDTFNPLELIFPKERYTHSIMQGMMTSIGTNLWENLAIELAANNNFEILNKNDFNSSVPVIPDEIYNRITKFNKSRINTSNSLDILRKELKLEIEKLKFNKNSLKYEKIPKGEGVDLWFKKNDTEYMFETKTVQINSGSGTDFSFKLCKWNFYRLVQEDNSNLNLITAVAFPYDPDGGDFYKKRRGRISPLIPGEDALVGNEFWDLLTGEKNTLKKIVQSFKEVGKSGVLDKYKDKFYKS
jgi:hypothetical protein